MAAFIQGALYQSAFMDLLKHLAVPAKVEQPVELDNETYSDHFLIRLASGIVIRVTVSVEKEADG